MIRAQGGKRRCIRRRYIKEICVIKKWKNVKYKWRWALCNIFKKMETT